MFVRPGLRIMLIVTVFFYPVLLSARAMFGVQLEEEINEKQCVNVVKEYLASFDDSLIEVSWSGIVYESRIENSTTSGVLRIQEIASGEKGGRPFSSESQRFSNKEWAVSYFDRTVGGKKREGSLVGWDLSKQPLARYSPTAETIFVVDKQSGEPASKFIDKKCEFSAKEWPREDVTLVYAPVSGSKHVFYVGAAVGDGGSRSHLVVKKIHSSFELDPADGENRGEKQIPLEKRIKYDERVLSVISFQQSDPYRTPQVLQGTWKTRTVEGTEYEGTEKYTIKVRPLEFALSEEIAFVDKALDSSIPVRFPNTPDIPYVLRNGNISKVIDVDRPIAEVAVESREYSKAWSVWPYWLVAIAIGTMIGVLFIRRFWK